MPETSPLQITIGGTPRPIQPRERLSESVERIRNLEPAGAVRAPIAGMDALQADMERVKRNLRRILDQGGTRDQAETYAKSQGFTPEQLRGENMVPFETILDRSRGAPMKVRAIVGNAKSPEDALRNLQRFFPDAQPFESGNFVYTDPETGRPTTFNAEGFEAGDLAGGIRMGAQFIGSGLGAGVGAVASTPAGPGAIPAASVMVPVGAALGSQMAGQAVDIGMEALLGAEDTRGPVERTAQAAQEIGTEAILGKVGPQVAGAVGRGIGAGRSRLAGTGPQIRQAFENLNVSTEGAVGAITANPMIQGFQKALEKFPSSANRMVRAANNTLDDVGRAFNRIVAGTGRARTAQEGGEVLNRALARKGTGFIDRTAARGGELYDEAAKFFGEGERLSMRRTLEFLGGDIEALQDMERSAGFIVPPQFKAFMLDLVDNNGQMTREAFKAFRTYVGQQADDPRLIGDIPKAKWKQLYGAMAQDFEEFAGTKGPRALQAARRANNFWRGFRGRVDDFLENVVKSPRVEDAFTRAFAGDKKGATLLTALRRSMSPEDWGDLVAAKLHQMGLATPGRQGAAGVDEIFSPSTFLTNYNKLAPESRGVLFSGPRFGPLRAALDDLTRVAGGIKDVERMANPSGTAGQNIFMEVVSGGIFGGSALAAGGDVGTAIAAGAIGLGTPFGLARLMTNAKFVNWLARGARIAPTNFNGITAHLSRLGAIAKANPEIREEIHQFVSDFRSILPASGGRPVPEEATAAPR